jgi:hypothetical protein
MTSGVVTDQAKLRAKWKRRGIKFDGPRPICTECGAPGHGLWDAGHGVEDRWFCLCEPCEEKFKADCAERRRHAGLA